ncbi:hypothetical protein K190097F3_46230 [Enterocloster clostridioformis]
MSIATNPNLGKKDQVGFNIRNEGAKQLLLVDEVDNKNFLAGLFNAMYEELPAPKPKKKK